MATHREQREIGHSDPALTEARIDELVQLLSVLNTGKDAKAHIKARLDALYPTEYRSYCHRWRQVPGDHAPGRMLEFQQWQKLTAELNALKVAQKHEPFAPRVQLLERALLLES